MCPRSSQTLDREHRWITPVVEARVEWKKNGEKTTSAKNTEWEVLAES